jgi:anti-sigma factor RsiW
MTHPADDLLAAYVDGSLPKEDRVAVDAHLATCARCEQDAADASTARSALGAIPEEPVPEDLATPDAAEAAALARRRSTAPAWQRWVGPAAAVAAAALVVTLVLPKLGGGSADQNSRTASGASAQVGVQGDASQVPLEIQDTDYTPDTLSALAGQTADRVTQAPAEVAASGSTGSGGAVPKVGTPGAAAKATACIQTAFREVPGTLVRLIRADFQGSPAYVGLYAEGPGAGQAADTLTVRVAAVDGCAPLSFGGVPL